MKVEPIYELQPWLIMSLFETSFAHIAMYDVQICYLQKQGEKSCDAKL